MLRSKHCIGILGGRVGHAIYFVGYRDSSTLLGLDPHTVFKNPAKPSSSGNPLTRDSTAVVHINYDGNSNQSSDTSGDFVTDEYINQIHVKDFVSLDISQLDPSLAIGFYFSDREDFEQFYEEVKLANELKIVAGRTPLFTVGNSPPSFLDEDLWNIDRASTINGKGSADLDDGKDEDEYVFL